MSTPGQRLEVFILHKFKTKKYFCDLMEFHPNSLNKYAGNNAKSVFGSKYQAKLSDMGLNLAWYLTGQGEMLIGNEIHSNKRGGVPVYDIDVSATIVSSIDDISEEPNYYVDFKPFNDCVGWFPVYGDSMEPRYSRGELVPFKKVTNIDILLWGEAYMVITDSDANNLRTLKLVFQHPDPDYIILRSCNPAYPGDTIIHKKNVVNLLLAKGGVRINHI